MTQLSVLVDRCMCWNKNRWESMELKKTRSTADEKLAEETDEPRDKFTPSDDIEFPHPEDLESADSRDDT